MANVVEILVTAKNLTGPAMASVNAEVNRAGSGMRAFHKTALIAGAGLAVMGVESVKMAAKFDASMTLLHTQAGVAQGKMAGLKAGVLSLAGKVGQDPDSLAESLFHVESNFESMGISSKKALSLVETAAKGATVGHADLVDVTNALTAAVASGIPGVENMDKAMGVLNATVGVGDMKMQDLANAFGSGMVATVKGFGLNITDVGAALAVFGDNNIRGSLAGNQLRMSVMALAHPVATAGDTLKRLGLTTETLGKDMQKGGLKLALEDLVGRMKKAGISSKEQGQVITEAFGRKAGAGLNVLVSQMDRLESKYPALAEGAHKFGQSWEDTKKTFAFQMKALQSGFDALAITVGLKLIPPLQAVVGVMLAHKGATVAVAGALAGLLTVTVAVSLAMKAAAGATMLWSGATRGVAAVRGVLETLALKAMYLRGAFLAAGGGVAGLRAAFASLSTGAKVGVAVAAIGALVVALHELSGYDKAPIDIDRMATSLGNLGRTGKVTGELQTNLADLSTSIAMVSKGASDNKVATWISDFGSWVGIASGPGISRAKENVDAVDKALASLVQNGHADVAAAAADRLQKAWIAGGGTAKRFKSTMDDYKAAMGGSALSEKLAADSMGLFGDKAVSTQKALDGEAQSAKGLEESIMALNAVHRGAFDAETAFQQAISNSKNAIKENGKTLNIHTEAGRKNRDVLSQLAAKTEDLVDKKLKEKVAWKEVDATYKDGRRALINAAKAMGDTKKQAEELADTILRAPKAQTTKFKGDIRDLQSKIATAKSKLKGATPAQTAHIKGEIRDLQRKVGQAQAAIWGLKGRTITVSVRTAGIAAAQAAIAALGGIPAMPHARGGLVHGYAGGGAVQAYPGGGLVQGPGTATSDSITALSPGGGAYRVSDSEYVVRAAAVKKYGVGFMDALNSGSLKLAGFAKGGLTKKQKAAKAAKARAKAQADSENEARRGAMGELTISHFGHMAGYKRSEFGTALAKPDSVSSLVNSLNQWASIIKKATHGATESKLLKALDSTGKKLLGYEKSLTKVTASLDKAKDKLNSLKDAAASLSDSVKGGVLSSANITRGAGGEAPVTTKSVMAGLTASRDKASSFDKALKQLKAKGLSKDLIQQIAEAGIEGGGLETAGALLGASGSEIKSMNKLQGQIGKSAGSAGKTTADAVYKDAIARQSKIVTALGKQQAKLTTSMDNLTKSLEKLVQATLGKKAKAGKKASGGIVGAAASGGLRGGLTWVGEQEPELLDLPVGSRVWSGPDSRRKAQAPWMSMLNTPRRSSGARRAAAPAGGGWEGRPIVVHVMLDGKVVARQIVDPFRAEIAHRGGNVQRVLGQGAG